MLIVVTYGLFRQSRWSELVAVYGGKAVFLCKPRRFQNVRVNGVTFSGMMTMACDGESLVIKPVFPVSMYMQPITIPLKKLRRTDRSNWGFALFEVAGVKSIELGLEKDWSEKISPVVKGSERFSRHF